MVDKEPYVGALVDTITPSGYRYVGVIQEIESSYSYQINWRMIIHPSIESDGVIGVRNINGNGFYSRGEFNVL